jgi:hypothetical protein
MMPFRPLGGKAAGIGLQGLIPVADADATATIDFAQSTRFSRGRFSPRGVTMLRRLGFAALILAAAAPGAVAVQTTIGGVAVTLPPPGGFCELSEINPSDKRMVTTLTGLLEKSGNKLLSMSADCGQLADWRTGKRKLLDDYAQYQTAIASMNQPPSETVEETCTTLRAEGNKILANQMPDIKARVESTLKEIKMNATTFIGVLAEDSGACYAGLIQKIHTEAGTDKTQITAFAITIIKDRSIFVYRFAVYQNADTVNVVLAKLKNDVAALLAVNR